MTGVQGVCKNNLLLIDDYGLAVIDVEQRDDLLEILEDRHGMQSTLVTSHLPVAHCMKSLER